MAGERAQKSRLADPHEFDALAAVLARAFYHDPFMVFALPDDASRLERAEGMFSAQLKNTFVHTAQVHTTPELSGAAIWTPPDPPAPPPDAGSRIGQRMRDIFADRLALIGEALGQIYRHRPEGDHWYLDFLGTDPAAQRQGVGRSVLAPVLQECDATGTAAILWTTTEANVAFYTNRGFEVTADLQPAPGPRVWWMRRAPR